MTDIETRLAQLYVEADKLMEEIKEAVKPSSGLIQRTLDKLGTYPFQSTVEMDVWEGRTHYKIYLSHWYHSGSIACSLHVDNEPWGALGSHGQLVLIQALPRLVEEFIKAVRHEHLITPSAIKIKKCRAHWWHKFPGEKQ